MLALVVAQGLRASVFLYLRLIKTWNPRQDPTPEDVKLKQEN
jgi:hypothetical protein